MKVPNVECTNDWLLVKENPQGFSPGGVMIPQNADMGCKTGTVVKVGPGRVTEVGYFVEPQINPGDIVYLIGNGIGVPIDGVDYVLIQERHIMLTVPVHVHEPVEEEA
jgi:co-chaperonin GroES (HSP10)